MGLSFSPTGWAEYVDVHDISHVHNIVNMAVFVNIKWHLDALSLRDHLGGADGFEFVRTDI